MALQMHFPESWDGFGPKMMVLTEKEKRFCWAYLTHAMANGGYVNRAEAARDAGYSDVGEGAKVVACRLMQKDRITEALDELAQREMRGLAIPAMMALKRLVESPLAFGHDRAVLSVLNRTGFSEKTETNVNVKHTVDTKELEALARRLAQESGIDARKLLGRDTKVIEGEVIHAEVHKDEDASTENEHAGRSSG